MRGSSVVFSVFFVFWMAAWACNGHLDFDAAPRPSPVGGGGRGGAAGGGASGGGAAGGASAGGASAGGASGCRADTDCRLTASSGGVSLHCDPTQGGACVQCTSDDHCSRAGARRCELSLRRCVACLAASDCSAGQTCLANRCLATCGSLGAAACPLGTTCEDGLCAACEADDASTCTASAAGRFCLAAAPVCVACRSDADCGGGTPRCDAVAKTCVACASGRDCPATAPLCEPTTGACVPAG